MKKIAIVLVLFCFVSKATAHVSKAELKAQYAAYIADSMEVDAMEQLCNSYEKFVLPQIQDTLQQRLFSEWLTEHRELLDMRKSAVACERLTYEGFKAIRHDQKFLVRKR